MDYIARYFGFGEDLYEAEGWFSWQHIVFVTVAIAIASLLAIFFARKNHNKDRKTQLKVLKVAAITMLTAETIKIVLVCFRWHDVWAFRTVLPLFLCSILLISLPLAAFAKGKVQNAALDFTQIFGYLACAAGTYLAGNIFASPILSFHVNVSVFTHCISGFVALYITLTKLAKMRTKDLWIVCLILLTFELFALGTNILQLETPYESNYMFLTHPAGTPFSILMTIACNIKPVYTVLVMAIYYAYMVLFVGGYHLVTRIIKRAAH